MKKPEKKKHKSEKPEKNGKTKNGRSMSEASSSIYQVFHQVHDLNSPKKDLYLSSTILIVRRKICTCRLQF